MRLEKRLLILRVLYVVAVIAGALYVGLAMKERAALFLLIFPAMKLRRWLPPVLRARRALQAPPVPYADGTVTLAVPAGFRVGATTERGIHEVTIQDQGSLVRVFVRRKGGGAPQEAVEAFLHQLGASFRVLELERSERPLAGSPAVGARAVVSRWNDASVAQVLATRTPGGALVVVHAFLALGVPEGILEMCIGGLRVGKR